MQLYELLQLYRLYRPQLRDSTAEAYRYAIVSFERFRGNTPRVADLTETVLLEFVASRLSEGAEETVRRELGTLTRLWRFAWRRRLTQRSPLDADLPSIRLSREPPVALTIEQMRAVLHSASLEDGRMHHGPRKADWWVSAILCLYYSGARITALLAVEWPDLDIETGWLHFRATTAKTGRGQYVQLPEPVLRAVKRMGRHFEPRVWHWPYCRRQRHKALKRIMRRAGLPDTRQYGFHVFRRTTATQLAIRGGLQMAGMALGHASEEMTQRYVDPRLAGPSVAESLTPIDPGQF